MNPEKTILTIDTSAKIWSISLSNKNGEITNFVGDGNKSPSADLLLEINKLLLSSDLKLSEVDVFGVCVGPGSYTGIRIGVAIAVALSKSQKKQCFGFTIFDILFTQTNVNKSSTAFIWGNDRQITQQKKELINGTIQKSKLEKLDLEVFINYLKSENKKDFVVVTTPESFTKIENFISGLTELNFLILQKTPANAMLKMILTEDFQTNNFDKIMPIY